MNLDAFEKIVKNDYKIFVDTSSLMQEESVDVFLTKIIPLLIKYKRHIIIPRSVHNEINRHIKTHHKDIHIAQKILDKLRSSGYSGTNARFDYEFADNAILAQFEELRLKYNLCLITNDNSYRKDGNLAQDILDKKQSRSIEKIKDIRVFYVNNKGLCEFYGPIKHDNTSVRNAFRLPITPKLDDKILNHADSPSAGDFVYDECGQKQELLEKIGGTGGEGSAYLIKSNYICKVYKKGKATEFKKNKIEMLINNSISIDGVCLPELIIYNSSNQFVGYIMKKANGYEVRTSVFYAFAPMFREKFPTWNRLNLVIASLNILEKIKNLHDHNIILGDINPSNILIQENNEVFFIDTDSYQIEEYPCTVGMVPYTKKNHHKKTYSEYLRTKDDDIFAACVLIFQIMLPGKLPYSFRGGTGTKDNMSTDNFPYKCKNLGDRRYNNAPEGSWIFIWSHLPRCMRDMFCKVFKSGESPPLNDLIKAVREYKYQIKKGWQTTDILPTQFKELDDDLKNITRKIQ